MKTKKILILIPLIALLFSCVDTSVTKDTINNLRYSTIESARNSKSDSIVIIHEGYHDYVFIKQVNGTIELKAKYIANDAWLDMPWPALLVLMVISCMLGICIGKIGPHD